MSKKNLEILIDEALTNIRDDRKIAREFLNEIANQYEALLVLGCEAAVQTIQDAIQPTSCQVVQGMETVGLMSIKPKFQLPCKISLELASITPTQKSNDTMLSVEMKNYIIATGLAEQTRDCMLSRYH